MRKKFDVHTECAPKKFWRTFSMHLKGKMANFSLKIKFATGINNTGGNFATGTAGVVDTGGK
jgi:hypothetical protein